MAVRLYVAPAGEQDMCLCAAISKYASWNFLLIKQPEAEDVFV